MLRKTFAIISLSAFLICVYLLVTGSQILVKPLYKGSGLPCGTIITWIGLIAFPASVLFGIKKILDPDKSILRILNIVIKVNILLGLAWGFISYYLAGNWAFTFTPQNDFRGSTDASLYFFSFTLVIAILPLICLAVFLVHSLISRLQNKR